MKQQIDVYRNRLILHKTSGMKLRITVIPKINPEIITSAMLIFVFELSTT